MTPSPGDGIYTGIAQVDEANLAERADQDQAMLKTAGDTIPLFAGRAVAGSQVAPAISGPNWNQTIPSVSPAYLSSPFLGAHPEVPVATGALYWNAPGLDLTDNAQNWSRFRASSATCNGCHSSSDTGTHFQHVAPATGGT